MIHAEVCYSGTPKTDDRLPTMIKIRRNSKYGQKDDTRNDFWAA